MREIYLAFDGGGTKLAAAAVSKNGQILANVKVQGGINPRTSSEEQIRKTVAAALSAVEEAAGPFKVLHGAGYFMHNEAIFEELTEAPVTELDEGVLGLLAAGIEGDGAVILSGTGSDVFFVRDGKTAGIVGGYGAFLGDAGSGFAIGRDGINAAIASYEGRGEKTLLEELIVKKYPADNFRQSVYGIYRAERTTQAVADFCRECEIAADEGDAIAKEIFKKAALDLVSYAKAGYKLFGFDKKTPYTFSGGVLSRDLKREKPLMVPYITQALAKEGTDVFRRPEGDPVSGAVKWLIKKFAK